MDQDQASQLCAKFNDWLDDVRFQNYVIYAGYHAGTCYLRASFEATCATTNKREIQLTRQWLLHPNMTKSEVIQTALKCCLASVEHEAREAFKYRGRAIFGPHLSVDTLWNMAEELDGRPKAVPA